MTRAIVSISAAIALTFAGIGLVADQAAASPVDDEQLFVQMVNRLRADHGLRLLAIDGELTSEARAWTSVMASTDQLAHTANMAAGITSPWTVLGENVGVHEIHDVQQLFDAFINSPGHYENLVDPRYRFIGIGVVHSTNGKLWTTHRFMATADQAAAPPPVTTPTTKVSPAPAVSSPDRPSTEDDLDQPSTEDDLDQPSTEDDLDRPSTEQDLGRPETPSEPQEVPSEVEESKDSDVGRSHLPASYWVSRDRALLDRVRRLV